MLKKCQKHVEIISIKDQRHNKKLCEDENISFYFLGIKIKICYIYKGWKTYVTHFIIIIGGGVVILINIVN